MNEAEAPTVEQLAAMTPEARKVARREARAAADARSRPTAPQKKAKKTEPSYTEAEVQAAIEAKGEDSHSDHVLTQAVHDAAQPPAPVPPTPAPTEPTMKKTKPKKPALKVIQGGKKTKDTRSKTEKRRDALARMKKPAAKSKVKSKPKAKAKPARAAKPAAPKRVKLPPAGKLTDARLPLKRNGKDVFLRRFTPGEDAFLKDCVSADIPFNWIDKALSRQIRSATVRARTLKLGRRAKRAGRLTQADEKRLAGKLATLVARHKGKGLAVVGGVI